MPKMNTLDDLTAELRRIAKRADELEGRHEVNISELLTDSFMVSNTSYPSLNQFFKAFNIPPLTDTEAFEAVSEQALDYATSHSSNFSSWQEMLEAAASDYVTNTMLG